MIKKLRRRFIAVNMCILTSVLLGVLTGIYVYMYSSEVRISYELMESILNEPGIGAAEPDMPREPYIEKADTEPRVAVNMSRELFYDKNNGNFSEDYGGDPFDFEDRRKPFPDKPFFPGDRPQETRPEMPEFTRPFPADENPAQEQQTVTAGKPVTETKSSEAVKTESPVTTAPRNSETEEQPVSRVYYEETESTAYSSVSVSVTEAAAVSSVTEATTEVINSDMPVPPFDKDFPDPYKGNVKRAYIMLLFGREGELDRIIYQYFDDVDENELRSAAQTLINSGNDRGKTEISNYKLRYMKKNNNDRKMMNGGFRLLFLDRTLEISTINRLLFIFIIIGGTGVIVIFGISVLLANWMIKPVDKAWKQQKQFVADASHELKTPLTVISSNTDVILSSPDDTVASQAKWLNYIKEETKRMTKLVNNMLYIAKYDSNEIKFVTVKFDLSDVMSSICLQYEALLFEQGKTLDTEIEENIFINGDEDKLKQLINILLDNAGKYSSENGRIKAVLTKEQKTGRTVIEVSNTSGYIPAEKLEKLFDRFYRLDNSRNRKSGGSGLGLNIARTIAEAHGGRIYAKHERSITTFIVEL